MKFWKFIRSKRYDSRSPAELTCKEDKLHASQIIVNAFATHFRIVFRTTSDTATLSNLDITSSLHSISIISVEEDDIIHAIKKLKNRQAAGTDPVPSFFVLDCAILLANLLKTIFN